MKKLSILLALVLMFTSIMCLAGCGEDADTATDVSNAIGWEYVENKGELIIGLDDTFAPMGFRDENNNLVGFDIDLANAVGKELGVKVTFKPIDWNSKELELSSKNIDCIWNGMSATEERQKSMSLTKKYLNNEIIILLGEGVTVESKADLADLKIVTQEGSAALESMQADADYKSFESNIETVPDYDTAITGLKGGRYDCIVIDKVLAEYKNSKLEKKFAISEVTFGDDFYAIGCRKADTTLSDKINEAIKTLIDNGEAAKISEKWFGRDIVILEDY